ncbi:hypothetical protein, partial [Staphylococcus aureus]|uniref:hypothetical protein n=1 Tax=Staphylococcus aureus TaxID=1280 RepID=UPI00210913F8
GAESYKEGVKAFAKMKGNLPDGKYDHIPEEAFRLVGSMDDVIAKAKDMGVEV